MVPGSVGRQPLRCHVGNWISGQSVNQRFVSSVNVGFIRCAPRIAWLSDHLGTLVNHHWIPIPPSSQLQFITRRPLVRHRHCQLAPLQHFSSRNMSPSYPHFPQIHST